LKHLAGERGAEKAEALASRTACFTPRCEHAPPRCVEEPPPALMEIGPGREVSCFLYPSGEVL